MNAGPEQHELFPSLWGALWLVLASYAEVVAPAFFGSFVATILIFSMAFFVREYD